MSLQDDLKKAEAALADTKVKSYTYKGKKYSLTELRDELIPELKELVDAELAEESRAEAIIASGNLTLRKAKEAVAFYKQTLETNRRAFGKNRSGITEADLDDLEAKLKAAELRVTELEKIASPVVAPVARGPIPAAGSPEAVAAARARLREGERTEPTPVTETRNHCLYRNLKRRPPPRLMQPQRKVPAKAKRNRRQPAQGQWV
jgi:hypothetical protein